MRTWALCAALLVAICRAATAADAVLTGLDVLEQDGFRELRGKRIGLATNQTGKDREGRSIIQLLAAAPGVRLSALFAPEHGLDGVVENAKLSSATLTLADGRTIPIYPSFGAMAPPAETAMSGLDAMVFDIQDVGVRFYTYATTMAEAMKMAAKKGIPIYVLDRPNPINGETVEGPVLDPGIRAFIAYLPEPVRHGLTMGEIARLANEEIKADLRVIPMKGWRRSLWYDQTDLPWIRPSPNMPDLDSATLYPGVACLESTNLAVGRGTPIPFRWIGAPWLDVPKLLKALEKTPVDGVSFQAQDFTPEKDVYKGKLCRGVRIDVKDREKVRPLDVFAVLVCALRDTQPKAFELRWTMPAPSGPAADFFMPTTQRAVGTERFRTLYESGASAAEIMRLFHASAAEFKAARSRFLLY